MNVTEEVENNERATIVSTVSFESNLDVVSSTLEITNLHKSDEGQYTCTGENGVENLIGALDRSSAYLVVQG